MTAPGTQHELTIRSEYHPYIICSSHDDVTIYPISGQVREIREIEFPEFPEFTPLLSQPLIFTSFFQLLLTRYMIPLMFHYVPTIHTHVVHMSHMV